MLASNPNDDVNVILETGGSAKSKVLHNNATEIDFSTVQRHIMKSNSLVSLGDLGKINMGSPQTLSDFISWGKNKFPAKKYGIILWDHGLGIGGFGKDINFDDTLTPYELNQAFYNSKVNTNVFFDSIGFDACLMSSIEISTILSKNSFGKFLIASEEREPNWGWNYTSLINTINQDPYSTGDKLGRSIMDSYVNDSSKMAKYLKYGADRDITLSVINLQKIPALDKILTDLFIKMQKTVNDQQLIDLFKSIDTSEHYGIDATSSLGFVDIYNLLSQINKNIPGFTMEINKVENTIQDSVIYYHGGPSKPFAHGLSIYMPLFKSEYDDKFIINSGNLFRSFLTDYIRGIIVDDDEAPIVRSSINGNNITTRVFGADVAKIYMELPFGNEKYQYIQSIDPINVDAHGFMKSSNSTILNLCNEIDCIPVTMKMDMVGNKKFIYIPVTIESPKTNEVNKQVSLLYDLLENGSSVYLGAVPNIVHNEPVPKENVNLTNGDLIYPLVEPNVQFKLPSDVKDPMNDLSDNKSVSTPIKIIDPNNLKLQYSKANSSHIARYMFCDYSDNCDQTRPYLIKNVTVFGNEVLSSKSILAKETNDLDNYIYINPFFKFKINFPTNWISQTSDPFDDRFFADYTIVDPYLAKFSPINELLSNSNKTMLPSLGVASLYSKNSPNAVYKFWKKFNTQMNANPKFSYVLYNNKNETINGNPAYEFYLNISSNADKMFGNAENRLSYYVTIKNGDTLNLLTYEAFQSDFQKYLPEIKKIINTFDKFNKNTNNSYLKLVNESEILNVIDKKMRSQSNITFKTYIDPLYKYKILYPYKNNVNDPVRLLPTNDNITIFNLPIGKSLFVNSNNPFLTIKSTYMNANSSNLNYSYGDSLKSLIVHNLILKSHFTGAFSILNATYKQNKDIELYSLLMNYIAPTKAEVQEREFLLKIDNAIFDISFIYDKDKSDFYKNIITKILNSFEYGGNRLSQFNITSF